jgi:hypothetical protein
LRVKYIYILIYHHVIHNDHRDITDSTTFPGKNTLAPYVVGVFTACGCKEVACRYCLFCCRTTKSPLVLCARRRCTLVREQADNRVTHLRKQYIIIIILTVLQDGWVGSNSSAVRRQLCVLYTYIYI